MRRTLLAALVCAVLAPPLVDAQSRGKSFSGSSGRSVGAGRHFSGFRGGHSGFRHHGFRHHGFNRKHFSFGARRRNFHFGFGFGRRHGGFFHHRKGRFHRFRSGYPIYYPYYVYPSYAPYYSSAYNGRYNRSYGNGNGNRNREPVRYDDDVEGDDSRYFDSRENSPRHRPNSGPRVLDAELAEESGPSEEPSADDRKGEADETQAVLVLRGGRRLEMANYAITDQAVYHLRPGARAHRIGLLEVDLPATRRLNQQLGLDFRLPGEARTNAGIQ